MQHMLVEWRNWLTSSPHWTLRYRPGRASTVFRIKETWVQISQSGAREIVKKKIEHVPCMHEAQIQFLPLHGFLSSSENDLEHRAKCESNFYLYFSIITTKTNPLKGYFTSCVILCKLVSRNSFFSPDKFKKNYHFLITIRMKCVGPER